MYWQEVRSEKEREHARASEREKRESARAVAGTTCSAARLLVSALVAVVVHACGGALTLETVLLTTTTTRYGILAINHHTRTLRQRYYAAHAVC